MTKSNNYDASSITVLEGLEAVRKRPGMYIGSVSTKGLNHLIYEIVDNAVDEHLAGYCDRIRVTLEADGSATIDDNGRGIPVGMHEKGVSAERLVFTTLHAGGKFDNSAYKTSGGLHGVGSSVVNALSTRLTVRVRNGGLVYEDRYEQGIPVIELENGLLPVVGKSRESGTCVNFLPDGTIFEKTRFKEDEVKSRLHETAYLNPQLTIVFEDKRRETPEVIEFHEPDGIVGFIKDLNKTKEAVSDIIYFSGESEGISVEVALQYVNEFHENVLGFCNNIYNAEGGTHLTGFKTMFTSVINSYSRELNILKEKDANFTGAMACFHTWNEERAQEIMTNEDVLDFLNKEVTARLVEVKGLELSERDTRLVGSMFHVINDMERVGDHSVNVLDAARLKEQENVKFTEKATRELEDLSAKVESQLQTAFEIFRTQRDTPEILEKVEQVEEEIDQTTEALRNHHVDRLKNKKCSARNGMLYLDMLTNLERIGDHAENIATSVDKEAPSATR